MKLINLKIVLVIGISIFFIFSYSHLYATTKLEVENAQAKPGENVTISVNLSDNSGMVGAEVVVNYDSSKLEYIEGKNGNVLNGKMGSISNNENGIVKLACVGQGINGNGSLMILKFRVKNNVKDAFIPIGLEVEKMIQDLENDSIVEVETLVKNGKILILHDDEIKIDSNKLDVKKQSNGNYIIQVNDSQNVNIKYTSVDESIATVDEKGIVVPKKSGCVEIVATLEDGTKHKVDLKIPNNIGNLKNAKEDVFEGNQNNVQENSIEKDSMTAKKKENSFSKKKIAIIVISVLFFVIVLVILLKKKWRIK